MTDAVSKFACAEHVEYVLEFYIDQYGLAPEINKLNSSLQGLKCSWCEQSPLYEVGVQGKDFKLWETNKNS